MDLTFTPAQQAWRAGARAWIAEYGIKTQGETAPIRSLSGGQLGFTSFMFPYESPSQRFFGQLIVARSHRPLGMVLPLLDVAIFLIDFFLRELLLDKLVA